jgi:hypothetical protein
MVRATGTAVYWHSDFPRRKRRRRPQAYRRHTPWLVEQGLVWPLLSLLGAIGLMVLAVLVLAGRTA